MTIIKINNNIHYNGTGRRKTESKRYEYPSNIKDNIHYLNQAFLEKINNNGNFQIRLGKNRKEYLNLLQTYIHYYSRARKRVRTLPLVMARHLYHNAFISDKNILSPEEAMGISTGPILLFKIFQNPISFCLLSVLAKTGAEAPFIFIKDRKNA